MLNMVTGKQYLAIGAGVGAMFLGYCIYFDQKRRRAPDFKQRLIEKRRQQKEARLLKAEGALPDLRDAEAVQRFFMEEIQTGEALLGQGDIEAGVEHLATAIAVCAQPSHLLQMLQQTLPSQIFELILASLPKAKQKFSRAREALIKEMSVGGGGGGSAGMGAGAGTFGLVPPHAETTARVSEIQEDDVE